MRSVDEAFGAETGRLLAMRDRYLAVVADAVRKAIDDDALADDDAHFPSARRLTGECYISSESFWVDSEPWYPRVGRRAQHRFSVTVHCLEHADGTVGEDRDYLGLEVHFEWRPDLGDFVFDGDVDSRSI